jgi:hypothetical protein
MDEANNANGTLQPQRSDWSAARDDGAKVFVAGGADNVTEMVAGFRWSDGLCLQLVRGQSDLERTAKATGMDTSAVDAWIADLKSADLTERDLDEVRASIIGHILALGTE